MYYNGNRVVIVDFNHIAFNLAFGGVTLTTVINGQTINTAVPNGAMKNVMKWSNNGKYPTVICFDRACPARKAYFQSEVVKTEEKSKGYKGTRDKMNSELFKSIQMTEMLLRQAGVKCLAREGYEADDIVFAAIQKAKEQYPGVPIDVITGDSDLLPLVDEQVSVFFRSRMGTSAEYKNIEKHKYIQVTPRNFSEIVESLSSYKSYKVPYNYLLLFKLLRGDDSDNVPGAKKLFPPRKVKEIISRLQDLGYKGIRYGVGEFTRENPQGYSEEIKELVGLLKEHCSDLVTDEGIDHILKIYKGINLNQGYLDVNPYGKVVGWLRSPLKVADFGGFNANSLIASAKTLNINIKLS